jgi:tetrahydromethanopterin S-methyltransferase subunit B
MRGELRSALSEVKRHDGEIVKNTERISSLENRMTAVETTAGRDDSHQQRAVSSRAAFFTMIGACVAVLTLLAAILFQVRGG